MNSGTVLSYSIAAEETAKASSEMCVRKSSLRKPEPAAVMVQRMASWEALQYLCEEILYLCHGQKVGKAMMPQSPHRREPL